MNNIIQCAIGAHKHGVTVTRPAWLYDYGMKLKIVGLELPTAYEVDFAHSKSETATRMVGDADGVDIPNALFESGTQILAWLYVHEDLNDGYTVYEIKIPLLQRPHVEGAEPTPAQQDAIDVAIAALNNAIEITSADVVESDANADRAENAAEAAQASATAASSSETNVRNYANQAAQFAQSAQSSASTATASATAAASNAGSAANAASSAAESSGAAETARQQAESEKKAAQTARTGAERAETNAGSSASAAATSASAAATAAGNAAQSASSASGFADNAQVSATAAAGSASSAASANTAAQQAKTDAETAKTDAEAARDRAETAAQTLVLDPTLTSPTQAAQAKAVGDALNTTNQIVALDSPIVLDTPSAGSGYIASSGNVGSNTDYNHTDYIDISNYTKVLYRRGAATGTAVQYVAVYNSNKELIRAARWGSNAEVRGYLDTPGTINVVDGDKYARFTMFADTDTFGDFYAEVVNTPLSNKFNAVDNAIANKINKAVKTGINLFDPESAVSGYIKDTGNISSGASYITSDYIPIKNGQQVYINRIRTFLAFDAEKNPITDSYVSTTQNNFVYTATQDGYIRASLFTSYADRNIIAYGTRPLYYEPYNAETAVEPGVHLSNDMISDALPYAGNVLDGKKWVACGDSFTHGDFQRSLTDDYVFTDSPYYGQNKVYPFWIGRRNRSMTVINDAISGSTMTAGETGVNPFSESQYLAVPADADYITLMFGINDSGNNCPIGTIDDADNTTFYGAWNVVLEYFITNFPYAHIGIIVGPGMQTTQGRLYAEAEIAVAKKWGIPYLNIQFESGGENIPLMLRTSNPDVSATAKALRNSQQYVNNVEGSVNMHPNEKAHEFESTFIEAWLRTL